MTTDKSGGLIGERHAFPGKNKFGVNYARIGPSRANSNYFSS